MRVKPHAVFYEKTLSYRWFVQKESRWGRQMGFITGQ